MSSDDRDRILARRAFLVQSALATAGITLGVTRGAMAQEVPNCLQPVRSDMDNDSIPDVQDQCPDEPENYNGYQDEDGCPDPQVCLSIVKEANLQILEVIYFKSGSHKLQPESHDILDAIAQVMLAHPDITLGINGHTDSSGDAESNKILSHKRAKAVCKYLVEANVPKERIRVDSFGEERPIATHATEEGRAQNNRVDFEVLR